MSKSDPSDASRINLTDDDETIVQKIRKAKTDPSRCPPRRRGWKAGPEALNLVGIYAALTASGPDAVLAQFGGQGFGAFKPALADLGRGVARADPGALSCAQGRCSRPRRDPRRGGTEGGGSGRTDFARGLCGHGADALNS